jgi:hypothetical protein
MVHQRQMRPPLEACLMMKSLGSSRLRTVCSYVMNLAHR